MIEIIFGLSILIFLSRKKKNMSGGLIENYHGTLGIDHNKPLLNLYGETLKSCRLDENDNRGSWDENGLCSEIGGGVHQICFKLNIDEDNVNNDTSNFSSYTGQSDWSLKDRLEDLNLKKNQHCMCLGAWALYKAKQDKGSIAKTNGELVCDSIPEIALSKSYVNKWSTWNGNELPKQIVNGVNSMFSQCYDKENKQNKKKYLKNKYCNFASKVKSLKNSNTYKNYCK